jgi:hypothetical protein
MPAIRSAHTTTLGRGIWAILAACGTAGLAAAQSSTITVDCSGRSIPSSGSTAPDIVVTGTSPILPAAGYQFAFNPNVTGTGFVGFLVVGSNKSLCTVLDSLFIGGQRTLLGSMRNTAGTLPTRLDSEVVGGTFSGLTISLTFNQQLLASGVGYAAVTNITKPSGLGLDINSGGLVVSTWTPPAPVISEWHFDGDLQSVKESGLAPTSGPSRIRYLDDPAFGPLLGGVGSETNYPSPPTPTGVTQTQSSFGTTTSFGIPNIGPGSGEEDTVYKTSPPRNASAPTDTAKSRGLGLALWPNTRDFWPDERIGQWTMVADILIPQASWDAAHANAAANNQCIPILEASANDNSSSDVFLTVSGSGPGVAKVGNTVPYAGAVSAGAIGPNIWFRLAIVNDLYGKAQSRIFVNGALIGTSGADWVYNACKSTDPRWGDNSAQPASGTAAPPAPNASVIPAATWNGPGGWGQFPSPWAYSGGAGSGGAATGAPTASTVGLFCDINGWGESVYIANLMFTDQPMSDSDITQLGAPNARGIVYLRPAPPPPCAVDFDGMGGVSVQDIFAFLNAWFAGDPRADFDGMGGIAVADIFAFLNAWFIGCP